MSLSSAGYDGSQRRFTATGHTLSSGLHEPPKLDQPGARQLESQIYHVASIRRTSRHAMLIPQVPAQAGASVFAPPNP